MPFSFRDIAVNDKNDEIGAAGDFLRQCLALFPAGLIQTRGIDEKNTASIEFGPGGDFRMLRRVKSNMETLSLFDVPEFSRSEQRVSQTDPGIASSLRS